MTKEEAQIVIGNIPIKPEVLDDCYSIAEYQEAKTMAIKALEQEPKIGHWIKKSQYSNNYCSECHYELLMIRQTKYCPNCGAKMAESEDKE